MAVLAACIVGVTSVPAQERAAEVDSLRVLPARSAARKGDGPLRDHLRREVHSALANRRKDFERLKSTDAIAAHRGKLRRKFIESLGGFPARTPLNRYGRGRKSPETEISGPAGAENSKRKAKFQVKLKRSGCRRRSS